MLPWAIGLAASAATNRDDDTVASALKSAGEDPTRWLASRPYRSLPGLQPGNPAVAPWYFDWITHSSRDAFWRQWSIRDRYPSVRVPVLDFEGWYDAFLAGGIENFTGMTAAASTPAARANQRLIIGPWDHLAWGRPDSQPAPLLKDIGAVGDSPINELMLSWYDHFLKGVTNSVSGSPRVDYFLMGANTWHSATSSATAQYPFDPLLPVRRRPHGITDRLAHHLATAGWSAAHGMSTTRPTRRRAWADIPAAVPVPVRRGPMTSCLSNNVPMYWFTAATRYRRTPR